MEVAGVRVLIDPTTAGTALAFLLGGILLGTVSGLVPGLHANTFALLLAATAAAFPGPPAMIGIAMLAAGVVHTFLDVVPAIALGVPDAAMAATALPGHRLVIEGRGREALRLSALGSGLAVLLAVPLAVPVTAVMTRIYPLVRPHLPTLLLALAAVLALTEPTVRAMLGGAVIFAASAALGVLTLDRAAPAPIDAGGMLAPLFAGLFGAPVLFDAMRGGGFPPQGGDRLSISGRALLATALAGTAGGAAVGYLPGVSSAIAAVLVLAVLPAASGDRGFVVAVSGVNTANTIFALFALFALGQPRTGVLVALESLDAPVDLPVLLATTVVAAGVAFQLVPTLGDPYLRVIRRMDYVRLSAGVLVGLLVLAYLFAGGVGVAAFVASALLGTVPPRIGARRVHLMGVLMGPLILRGVQL